jgi:TrmH family RNA methyltransferase
LITSTDNQQAKALLQLNKKAKYRKKEGLFVAEGIKMFEEAPKEQIKAVYVSSSFLAQPESEMRLSGTTYIELSGAVFKAVSDTMTPQGILTVLHQKQYVLEDLLPDGRPACILVLESIQDPGNLGTMMRAGEGAGITGILMNRTTVDLYNPKTIRSTMGSIFRVPHVVTDDLEQSLQELKEAGVTLYAAHLNGTMDYDEAAYEGDTAFLIGNEGNGLSDEISSMADVLVRIPMEGQVESLNAAIAATLLAYEAKRQRKG